MRQHADNRKLMIAVLMGGDSAEREISLASGICAAAALEAAGHRVEAIDPAEVDLIAAPWSRFDACFIALHGGAGEDGRVQSLLENLKVPYTGSGPLACRWAMSKSAAKERFARADVPTPTYVMIRPEDSPRMASIRAATLGFPLIVKPDAQGSSLGVNIALSLEELPGPLAASRSYDKLVLCEQLITGREFTVSLLGRQSLPMIEIITPGMLFTYDSKYHHPQTKFNFEIDLPAPQVTALRKMALAAAATLGTKGLARVDLMLDRAGKPWVLEVNTVPGLTERSLAPRAAAHAGLAMPDLCEWLVRDCLAKEKVR